MAGAGKPLTPTRAEELILGVVKRGVWFSKREIIPPCVQEHHRQGGVSGGELRATFKKALQKLRNKNKIEYNGERNVGARYMIPDNELPSDVEQPDLEPGDTKGLADRVVGSSEDHDGYLYVIDEDGALKIGNSRGPDYQRVRDQMNQGRPNSRRCVLIYHTDNERDWENIIHRLMKVGGRSLSGESGGREWFHASPREVESIINILKNLVLL